MNYFIRKRKGWIRDIENDKKKNSFEKDLSALDEDQEKIGKEKEIEDENGEER